MTVCRQYERKSHTTRKAKPEIHLSVLSLHLTVSRWDEKHGIALRETALLHICRPQLLQCSSRNKAHIQEYLDASRTYMKGTCLKDQCAKHCRDEYGNTGPAPH